MENNKNLLAEVAEATKGADDKELKARLKELIESTPSRQRARYTPDFSISKAYEEYKATDTTGFTTKDMDEHLQRGIELKREGTITKAQRKEWVDTALNSPISHSLAELKRLQEEIIKLESDIDNFDISGAQQEADYLYEVNYKPRLKGANDIKRAMLEAEYEKDFEEIRFRRVVKPTNEIKIKRYEAIEKYKVYDSRVKLFIECNRDIIERQAERAREQEVNSNLLELLEYMEG